MHAYLRVHDIIPKPPIKKNTSVLEEKGVTWTVDSASRVRQGYL
jgi:hypothetical protein